MGRRRVRQSLVVGTLAALASVPAPSARACTPVRALAGPYALAPRTGGNLGISSQLLLANAGGNDNRAALSRAETGERVGLVLERAFGHVVSHGLDKLAFYRPASELLGGAGYELTLFDGLAPIRFVASSETRRIESKLTLRISARAVEPTTIYAAACNYGPLVDREFSRVAHVEVDAEPAVPLLLSVVGHDTQTGEDAEDSAVSATADPGAVSLDFPLPAGVEPCVQVRVFDYAGDLLWEPVEACALETESRRVESAHAFDPSQAIPENSPPEGNDPHTSRGCQSAPGEAGGGVAMLPLALSLALWRCGRRRRVPDDSTH